MVVGIAEKHHYVEYGVRNDKKGYDAKCSCGWSKNKIKGRAIALGQIHVHLLENLILKLERSV